ncbi:hypothetical protein LSTR_LSTR010755 [Laodelphax striatellus]|uniref:Uncharacterized protein n=1 Tax=Laodelphax striatellus TaxID=195883 RepID=A0A482XR57_LAOST|nr:hypothetical protein LSTR_LSTR010755 [Laodelphax striatellus]
MATSPPIQTQMLTHPHPVPEFRDATDHYRSPIEGSHEILRPKPRRPGGGGSRELVKSSSETASQLLSSATSPRVSGSSGTLSIKDVPVTSVVLSAGSAAAAVTSPGAGSSAATAVSRATPTKPSLPPAAVADSCLTPQSGHECHDETRTNNKQPLPPTAATKKSVLPHHHLSVDELRLLHVKKALSDMGPY